MGKNTQHRDWVQLGDLACLEVVSTVTATTALILLHAQSIHLDYIIVNFRCLLSLSSLPWLLVLMPS